MYLFIIVYLCRKLLIHRHLTTIWCGACEHLVRTLGTLDAEDWGTWCELREHRCGDREHACIFMQKVRASGTLFLYIIMYKEKA